MTLFKLIQQLVTVILVRLDLAPTHPKFVPGIRIRAKISWIPNTAKMLKILTLMTLTRKIKQCKVALLKLLKKFLFSNMCKTWVRIRIRIWISIKMKSQIRIRICIKTMPIHITGFYRMKNGSEYEPPEWQKLSDRRRYYESNWRFTHCANSSKNNVSPPTNSRSKSFSSSNLCWRKIICEFS